MSPSSVVLVANKLLRITEQRKIKVSDADVMDCLMLGLGMYRITL